MAKKGKKSSKGKKKEEKKTNKTSSVVAVGLDPELERQKQDAIAIYREQVVGFLQGQLKEYQERSSRLNGEIQDLQQEAQRKESSKLEMVAYLQNEIKRTERESREVRTKLREFLEFERVRIQEIERQCNDTLQSMEKQFNEKKQTLQDEAVLRERELHELRKFRDDKNALEAGLAEAKKEIEEQIRLHEIQTAKTEQEYRRQLEDLKKDYQQKVNLINKTSKAEAERNLSVESKLLRHENNKLQSELRFHEEETDRMLNENDRLKKKIKELRHELELYQDRDHHYARRGAKQRMDIAQATTRINELENELSEAKAMAQRQAKKLKDEFEEETEGMRNELNNLRRLTQLKDKEVQHLRSLGQIVVSQRTELEQFFYEAMEEVRNEIAAKRHKDLQEKYQRWRIARAKPQHHVHGELSAKQLQEDMEQLRWKLSQKVDIKDLSLEDRERVLRLLFAKMNRSTANKRPPVEPLHAFEQSPTAMPPYSPGTTFVTEQIYNDKLDD